MWGSLRESRQKSARESSISGKRFLASKVRGVDRNLGEARNVHRGPGDGTNQTDSPTDSVLLWFASSHRE
jgi:hypothetical protein